jgi:hypothetical protein
MEGSAAVINTNMLYRYAGKGRRKEITAEGIKNPGQDPSFSSPFFMA